MSTWALCTATARQCVCSQAARRGLASRGSPRFRRSIRDSTIQPRQPGGRRTSGIVFGSQMSDEGLAAQLPQGVLELGELDRQIVLGIQALRVHRALEVERKPFLDAAAM